MVKRILGSVFALLLVLIGLVWLLFAPQGNVSAHVDRLPKGSQLSAVEIFSEAQPMAFQMLGDWAYVTDILGNPDAAEIEIADEKYRDSRSIRDALDIEFSFERETGGWKTTAKFYVAPILEQLYVVSGQVDYDFVFFDFNDGGGTFFADVQIRPGNAVRRKLPDVIMGDRLALTRAIAEYVVEVAAARKDGWGSIFNECTAVYCPEAIPRSSLGLSQTRAGLRLIYLGSASEACENTPTVECALRKAKEAFQMANHDQTNHVARLGSGLASLKLAKRLLDDGRSEYEVAEEFEQAIVHLVRAAKLDSGVGRMIKNGDFGNLLASSEVELIDLNSDFVETAAHYLEAKTGLKPANYRKVLDELAQIKRPPRYLHGHIESIRLTAELFLAKTTTEAEPHLAALGKPEMRQAMRPWLWHYIYGYFLCYWNGGDIDRVVEAQKQLDKAQDNLPPGDAHSLLQLRTAKAYCNARTSADAEARDAISSHFDPQISRLIKRRAAGDLEQEDARLLSSTLLAKSEVLVALKEYEKAKEVIALTLEIDPEWEPFILRSPIFADYRKATQ